MWWHFITWQKNNFFFTISSYLRNDYSEYDNIDYWNENLQLTKVGENILLDPNGWLND